MRPVVKFSIRQSVFINVVFVILVVAGSYAVFTTPLENYPVVDMGNVFVQTVYFGASAEDVEQLVTTKIEEALDGLENVEWIQSQSYRNFSFINVKFIDDSDYKKLYDDLRFRVLNIRSELPPEVDDPSFLYMDTNAWLPVVIVNIAGDLPQRSLKLYAEELRTRLLSIDSLRDVAIEGDFVDEFHVSADPAKLRRYGITFQQLAAAIESANTKYPTGRFRKLDSEYMLDAGSKLNSQEKVLNVVVRRDGDGNFIRVADLVSNARLSHRDPSLIPSVNGRNTVRLLVSKEESGNAVAISAAVKKLSEQFEALHQRDGIEVIFTNDSTIEINDSLHTLGGNLILGMALVLIVLWISLGFRNAMLTAIGIPFAFLCSILVMKLNNVSLNSISLFAFVLVTGIMVDDAVIIVENIFRHFEMGKSRRQAVIDGTAEVMLPVISSAVTTVLAFLPMLIMTGSTGDFFAYIPKTVSFALAASLVEALFILPIHFLDWGPKKADRKRADENDQDPFHHLRAGLFAPFWKIYRTAVVFLLNHKLLCFAGMSMLFLSTVAILGLSISGVLPLIKVKFFPGTYFRYHVTIATPVGSSIEKTDEVVRELSRFIMSFGQQSAQSAAGSAGFYEDEDYVRHSGNNFGQIIVTMPEQKMQDFPENPRNEPMRHLEFMRREVQRFARERYGGSAAAPVVKVFEESGGPPAGKAVNIRITAAALQQAFRATDALIGYMQTEAELADLVDLGDDRPALYRTVKYAPVAEKAFEFGLLPGDVTTLVAGALNGRYAGNFRTDDEEVDLLVRIARYDDSGNPSAAGLSDPTDILDVPVVEDSASPVLLRDLVRIEFESEPNVRMRYKGKPAVTITSNIADGSQLSPARVQYLVKSYYQGHSDMFPGISISFGGEFESTSKSYTSLTFAFFIALMLIYLVLASQFKDYFQPVIIINAVPYALIGVVLGLLVTRTPFTVGSFLAIVGLAGIAVNDTLLLIDFMNVRRREGKDLREAIIESCAARMRPVIITTVTTMLGLLPMAIGIPNRSIEWAPMATAFVAGLSSATFLTLLITPTNYEFYEQMKISLRRRYRRRTAAALRNGNSG
ncbi:MAG: acriflavin resistance protein [Deltaproteobacteria bacterium SG8_13]|nr:MAG: acriflavin resistance protein [Deltaproteobacteria bacterium SG8_13]